MFTPVVPLGIDDASSAYLGWDDAPINTSSTDSVSADAVYMSVDRLSTGRIQLSPPVEIPEDHPKIIWPYQTEHWRDRWFNNIEDDNKQPETYAALASVLSSCYGSQLRLDDLSDFLMLYSRQEYAVSEGRMFGDIIPFIYKLIKGASGLPEYVLLPGDNVKISRQGVASIIAMMLFGMFDYVHMDDYYHNDDVPKITMLELFKTQNMNAFASVVGYFDTMVESAAEYVEAFDATVLVYNRVKCGPTADDAGLHAMLAADNVPMCSVDFSVPTTLREIKVCAVEELPLDGAFGRVANHTLMLYEHTELLAVGAFVPRLDHGESVVVYGADKFNNFNGRQYSGTSDYHYDYGTGPALMAKVAIVMVPPSVSGTTRRVTQDFLPDFLRLHTVFRAVRPAGAPIVISPYMIPWTIDVGGNVYSTFIQAWLATSMSGRRLVFPAGDCNLREAAARFVVWSRRSARTVCAMWQHWNMTVGRLVAGRKMLSEINLFSAMESYRSERTGGVRFRDENPAEDAPDEDSRHTRPGNNTSDDYVRGRSDPNVRSSTRGSNRPPRGRGRPLDDYRMVGSGPVHQPTSPKPAGPKSSGFNPVSRSPRMGSNINTRIPGAFNPFEGY